MQKILFICINFSLITLFTSQTLGEELNLLPKDPAECAKTQLSIGHLCIIDESEASPRQPASDKRPARVQSIFYAKRARTRAERKTEAFQNRNPKRVHSVSFWFRENDEVASRSTEELFRSLTLQKIGDTTNGLAVYESLGGLLLYSNQGMDLKLFGKKVTFSCLHHSDHWVGGIPPGRNCGAFHQLEGNVFVSFRFYNYHWPVEQWDELLEEIETFTYSKLCCF